MLMTTLPDDVIARLTVTLCVSTYEVDCPPGSCGVQVKQLIFIRPIQSCEVPGGC